MGQPAATPAIGQPSAIRGMNSVMSKYFGTSFQEMWDVGKIAHKSGRLGEYMSAFLGIRHGKYKLPLSDYMSPLGAAGLGPRGVRSASTYARISGHAAGSAEYAAAYSKRAGAIFRNRKIGVASGAALGLGMGISAVAGYSIFDQAQAVGGGIIGGRWARRVAGAGPLTGLGKFGVGAAAVGAGLGGQYMDWKQWGAASAGYWGVRGLQALGDKQGGAFLGRFGKGGGIGRAAGIGIGLGAEYLFSNVL